MLFIGNGNQILLFHTFCYVKYIYLEHQDFENIKKNYNRRDITSNIIISHINLCSTRILVFCVINAIHIDILRVHHWRKLGKSKNEMKFYLPIPQQTIYLLIFSVL